MDKVNNSKKLINPTCVAIDPSKVNVCRVHLSPRDEVFLRKWIQNVVRFHQNPNLRVRDIAKIMCICQRQLLNRLKAITGMGTKEFINAYRIDCAKSKLQTEDRSITDISEKCGFSDVCTFSKAFKKSTGMSPSDFRKLAVLRHRSPLTDGGNHCEVNWRQY